MSQISPPKWLFLSENLANSPVLPSQQRGPGTMEQRLCSRQTTRNAVDSESPIQQKAWETLCINAYM